MKNSQTVISQSSYLRKYLSENYFFKNSYFTTNLLLSFIYIPCFGFVTFLPCMSKIALFLFLLSNFFFNSGYDVFHCRIDNMVVHCIPLHYKIYLVLNSC